jgi:hypothetical protein
MGEIRDVNALFQKGLNELNQAEFDKASSWRMPPTAKPGFDWVSAISRRADRIWPLRPLDELSS